MHSVPWACSLGASLDMILDALSRCLSAMTSCPSSIVPICNVLHYRASPVFRSTPTPHLVSCLQPRVSNHSCRTYLLILRAFDQGSTGVCAGTYSDTRKICSQRKSHGPDRSSVNSSFQRFPFTQYTWASVFDLTPLNHEIGLCLAIISFFTSTFAPKIFSKLYL